MSVNSTDLKARIERLIALYKLEVAKNAGPDPTQADIDALTAEIDGVLPPA